MCRNIFWILIVLIDRFGTCGTELIGISDIQISSGRLGYELFYNGWVWVEYVADWGRAGLDILPALNYFYVFRQETSIGETEG